MASPSQETIILIEPNRETRARLMQAIFIDKIIKGVVQLDSLRVALQLLRNNQRGDIVFISGSFPHTEVLPFVSAAKNTPACQDAAFILITDDRNRDNISVAAQILKGTDGFLKSPFNVEAVQMTIRLALKVKLQRMRQRVEVATKMILSEVITQLDYAVYDFSNLGKQLAIPEQLVRANEIFRSYRDEERVIYFEVLTKLFIEAKPPLKFVVLNSDLDNYFGFDINNIDSVILALTNDDWEVRWKALDKLMDFGNQLLPYVSQIRKCLLDPKAACRRRAQVVLESIGELREHGSQ